MCKKRLYYLGDTILVHFICSDDTELGNYNIEIHSNFDHHTHGTSAVDCEGEEGKEHRHEEGEKFEYCYPKSIPRHCMFCRHFSYYFTQAE